MAKPSSTLTIEPNANPFVTPVPKKKEPHKEASTYIFTKTFLLSQACVNFTGEQACLAAHLAWRATNDAAGPLPCLKTATGCTPKAEQMLRLANDGEVVGKKKIKKDISTLFPPLPSRPTSSPPLHSPFHHAVSSALEAERFLHNAILARVPVPLGPFHGIYALYCPKYSATHVDKYANGARTLTVYRTSSSSSASLSSSSKKSDIYTARLSIPPSPVPCTIREFTPPPHASLRVTTLTTGAEGYTMGLVCLGNGYVLLRVDMGLLLTGKRSGGGGEDVCMEFLGVRAGEEGGKGGMGNEGGGKVEWFTEDKTERVDEEKDIPDKTEQEVSHDGPRKEKKEKEKKKRGRPSNLELERRAKEKAEKDERQDYDLWCRQCLASD